MIIPRNRKVDAWAILVFIGFLGAVAAYGFGAFSMSVWYYLGELILGNGIDLATWVNIFGVGLPGLLLLLFCVHWSVRLCWGKFRNLPRRKMHLTILSVVLGVVGGLMTWAALSMW